MQLLNANRKTAQEAEEGTSYYSINMSGSEWSVAVFGIVEFLRGRWYLRALFAGVAVMLVVLTAVQFAGFKPLGSQVYLYSVCLFCCPWLLWVATVSGNNFKLVFGSSKATAERQQAERAFAKSSAPEDALTLDMRRLNEYYVINQAQAKSSFLWAITTMIVGFATIIIGVWMFYFRTDKPDVFMTSLSTAAGIVVNIVSGLFIHLHNKTQDRSLHYYQQLAQVQKVATAIRLVEAHKSDHAQVEARNLVIKYLMSGVHTPPTAKVANADLEADGTLSSK